uniref:2Fe-2S ferredoxin-type domain-containing protein n=1 Tax=Odontella aurita TaxID=265563 RepID=A0A7S4JWQ5_9STRA|mmetsp:Transcript_56069/g.167824  ORF Transcript_56069/g.167824 Transcript_56069/m.167824 type:complete len:138 (+) Transcript_56069:197-610(+)
MRFFLSAILASLLITRAQAFGIPPAQRAQTNKPSTTELSIFGNALKGAFSNDDSLGKQQNAGLKGGPDYTEVTINGKQVKAVVGQKVSQVAASARVKISYSCKKGDCGTCEINMNGRVVKACQGVIPKGKCNIQTYN